MSTQSIRAAERKRAMEIAVRAAARDNDKIIAQGIQSGVEKALAEQELKSGNKNAVKTLVNALGKAAGVGEIAELGELPGALLYAGDKFLVEPAKENDAELGRRSDEQNNENATQYGISAGTAALRKSDANNAVADLDSKWAKTGQSAGTPGAANLKTAENAIHGLGTIQSTKDLRERALVQANNDVQTRSTELADAKDYVARVNSTPDYSSGGPWGVPLYNFTTPAVARKAQDDEQSAQQDVDRNQKQLRTLPLQLKRSETDVATATAHRDAAEAAALNTSPTPATPAPTGVTPPAATPAAAPAATPATMPAALPPSPAMQQLVQQQIGANQALNTLLEATRKSNAQEITLLQELLASQVELDQKIERLRAQLHNLQSTGFH